VEHPIRRLLKAPAFKTCCSLLVRGIKASLHLEIGLIRRRTLAHESSTKDAQGDLHQPERDATGADDGDRGSVARTPDGTLHHRAYVGKPDEWDLVAARQVTLLLTAGLRDNHRLVDVGCGSLRAGRMLIPYLEPERYFGVEPNRWLVEEGIEHELGRDLVRIKRPAFRFVDDFSLSEFGVHFDFAVAHSVFSHTYPDLALAGFRGIAEALAPRGKLFATFP
jgi:SAM-dependent methyltransferase